MVLVRDYILTSKALFSDSYSAGQAETLMGKAIKNFGWKRSDLVISTKVSLGAKGGVGSPVPD